MGIVTGLGVVEMVTVEVVIVTEQLRIAPAHPGRVERRSLGNP
jgi:hypothetical protein